MIGPTINQYPGKYSIRIPNAIYIAFVTISWLLTLVESAKVLDLNENLPDLIEKHPEKSWLVKFYAPWCHHCQQLEPIYNNVAESIYNNHDLLIVGRVDCTKAGHVCERFGVSSYPTISFINKDSQVNYRGDRSKESILAFADRLRGPTINIVRDCRELNEAVNKHGLVILSTIRNDSDEIRKEFENLAIAYKASHWFYQFYGSCKDLVQKEGLHLLKRHLSASIKFEQPLKLADGTSIDASSNDHLKKAIVEWLNKESFAVYGKASFTNIERMLATGRLVVISILDEYKPARQFTATSREFYRRFEQLAIEYVQTDDEVLFAWSSDLELVEHIIISPLEIIPNIIFLKRDFSYHLMLSNHSTNAEKSVSKVDHELLELLSSHKIISLISDAKTGKLTFEGGSTYLHSLMRLIIGNINKFLNMYRANPLLVLVIFGFPGVIIVLVIYTTCFYEGREADEEDEVYSDDEYGDETCRLLSNGHLKRD